MLCMYQYCKSLRECHPPCWATYPATKLALRRCSIKLTLGSRMSSSEWVVLTVVSANKSKIASKSPHINHDANSFSVSLQRCQNSCSATVLSNANTAFRRDSLYLCEGFDKNPDQSFVSDAPYYLHTGRRAPRHT